MISANLNTDNYVDFEKTCLERKSKLEKKLFFKQKTIDKSFETDDLSLLSSKRRNIATEIVEEGKTDSIEEYGSEGSDSDQSYRISSNVSKEDKN